MPVISYIRFRITKRLLPKPTPMKVLNCLSAGLSMVALFAWLSPHAHAQLTGLHIEPVITHDGTVGSSDLSGLTTYRLYGTLTSPEDIISAVYGNDENPLSIATTETFWQAPVGSVKFGTSINPLLIAVQPELAYDSWFTIGLESIPNLQNDGEESVTSIGMTMELGLFESGTNFLVNSSVGASYYALPGSTNGLAGEDLQVLLGQFTTSGQLSGTFNLQVFIGGNQLNEQLATFSFESGALGCTDEGACNFDPAAEMENNSCTYAESGRDCDGNCLEDADGDNICDGEEISGCQDSEACNFNAFATDDDGSCVFADGSCEICANGAVVLQDADGDGICDGAEIPGCQDASACNFDVTATDDDGSCVFADDACEVCQGGDAVLFDADGDGVCDGAEIAGCTDENACNFDASATDDDGSCTFADALLNCDGICLNDADSDGICDELEIAGCTNSEALNYDEAATDDDGSCIVDGSSFCGYGTIWDATTSSCVWDEVTGAGSSCQADFTDDGVISIADLLEWLPFYGQNCE